MPRGGSRFILTIVPDDDRDTVIPALREWLRNERRLGAGHVAVSRVCARPPAAPEAPAADPRERARPAVRVATPLLLPDDAELPAICDRELSEAEARQALGQLDEGYAQGCTKCGLHAGRQRVVFGEGAARPPIAFVGEGPGAEEDRQGRPFVGRAGQLLTRMIAAMTLTRDQVYICNIVKCRPPGNRTPTDQEVEACWPYLCRQLAIMRPNVIVALGRPATQTLLQTRTPIGRLRGEFQDFPPPGRHHPGLPTTKLMPTFHPAYLLRSPGEKAKSWEDLKQVMQFLGIEIPPSR